MRDYHYIKFTGDYSKLKSMGFEFQKLYAGNYMQWCKDHVRIWKRGAEITYDEVNLYQVLNLIRNGGNQKWSDGCLHIVKVYDKETRESYLLPYPEGFEMAKEWFLSFCDEAADDVREKLPEAYTNYVSRDLFEVMKELDGLWEFDSIVDKW